jgi:MFS transporter, DHA2 family, methylenomycin A resistance protein
VISVPATTARTQRRAGAAGTAGPDRAAKLALVAVCLGFFVIQLDVTIVNVALPAIQRDIGGTVAGLQWVIDAYTLALAAVMLTAGSAADRLGAKRVFMAGLAAFAAGSAGCAAAPGRWPASPAASSRPASGDGWLPFPAR